MSIIGSYHDGKVTLYQVTRARGYVDVFELKLRYRIGDWRVG